MIPNRKPVLTVWWFFLLCCYSGGHPPSLSAANTIDASILQHNTGSLDILTDVIKIEASVNHTCALTAEGDVKCWGDNGHGQLGKSRVAHSYRPIKIEGIDGISVVSLAAGGSHVCLLTDDGQIRCWGGNQYRQLGDGTEINRLQPVNVIGLEGAATSIVAGSDFSCALLQTLRVKCWGVGYTSSLIPNYPSADHIDPVAINGLEGDTVSITAGTSHACALSTIGTIQCWGSNYFNPLGDYSLSYESPVTIDGSDGLITEIDAGATHTCALNNDGIVQCWGSNQYGQLGESKTITDHNPVTSEGITGRVQQLFVGGFSTCILTENNEGQCWGLTTYTNMMTEVVAITVGIEHVCALSTIGTVTCWGSNDHGQLGSGGPTLTRAIAVPVNNVDNAMSITAGGQHTCAKTDDGDAKCWGGNFFGQLGNGRTGGPAGGSYEAVDVEVMIQELSDISAGNLHTCGATVNGAAYCWGRNYAGQLGDGTITDTVASVNVIGLYTGVVSIQSGSEHSCALTITAGTTGGVSCWGSNRSSQLGDGTVVSSLTPIDVIDLQSDVIQIAVGAVHSCAVTSNGDARCWGSNQYGQLGDGTTAERMAPVTVVMSDTIIAVGVGRAHSCALTAVGDVKCWGQNRYGQLGDDSHTDSVLPTSVYGIESGVAAIAIGSLHSCALTIENFVTCWGNNDRNQVGQSTPFGLSKVPIAINGLEETIVTIAAGETHTCALTAEGSVKCWGSNHSGQLGVNPGWEPVDVVESLETISTFLPTFTQPSSRYSER